MCSDNSSVHLTVDFLDSRQKNNLMTCLHFIRINCRQESARLHNEESYEQVTHNK